MLRACNAEKKRRMFRGYWITVHRFVDRFVMLDNQTVTWYGADMSSGKSGCLSSGFQVRGKSWLASRSGLEKCNVKGKTAFKPWGFQIAMHPPFTDPDDNLQLGSHCSLFWDQRINLDIRELDCNCSPECLCSHSVCLWPGVFVAEVPPWKGHPGRLEPKNSTI